MNTLKINKGKTLMVAHRGVSGLEQENTMLAFVAAGNRSYFGIETDIHVTSDGEYVAIHDGHTGRVAKEKLVIADTDFATLRALKLCDREGDDTRVDVRIPTLAEYIRVCKKYEKICVLELKNPMPDEDVRNTIACIEREEYLSSVIFISFSFDALVSVRKYAPDQPVQFLFNEFTDEIMEKVKAHRFDVDVAYHALTEERVRELHEAGMKVNCWTVNSVEDGERLAAWGVDFITTNILE